MKLMLTNAACYMQEQLILYFRETKEAESRYYLTERFALVDYKTYFLAHIYLQYTC